LHAAVPAEAATVPGRIGAKFNPPERPPAAGLAQGDVRIAPRGAARWQRVFAEVPDVEEWALVDMAPLNGIELPLFEPWVGESASAD
jgi:hypothetical protein